MSAQVPAATIRSLEHDFDWPTKLKRFRSGGAPTEVEKLANRALSYQQAQRMRSVVEESLRLMESPEELVKQLVQFKYTREGEITEITATAKAVFDLAKAMELCHNMCYRALGDKLPAQADTVTDEDKGVKGGLSTVRGVLGALSDLAEAAKEKRNTVTIEAKEVADVVPASA